MREYRVLLVRLVVGVVATAKAPNLPHPSQERSPAQALTSASAAGVGGGDGGGGAVEGAAGGGGEGGDALGLTEAENSTLAAAARLK